jgi:hypothetical protein
MKLLPSQFEVTIDITHLEKAKEARFLKVEGAAECCIVAQAVKPLTTELFWVSPNGFLNAQIEVESQYGSWIADNAAQEAAVETLVFQYDRQNYGMVKEMLPLTVTFTRTRTK